MQQNTISLSEKIQSLTQEQLVEVDQFVASLGSHDAQPALQQASVSMSEPAFASVWNNPEDDVYDSL